MSYFSYIWLLSLITWSGFRQNYFLCSSVESDRKVLLAHYLVSGSSHKQVLREEYKNKPCVSILVLHILWHSITAEEFPESGMVSVCLIKLCGHLFCRLPKPILEPMWTFSFDPCCVKNHLLLFVCWSPVGSSWLPTVHMLEKQWTAHPCSSFPQSFLD